MTRLRTLLAILLTIGAPALLLFAGLQGWGQTPSPAQIRRQADTHYAEKSYALAADEYRQALKRMPAQTPDRTVVEYRIAVSLGGAQKWDAALAAWESF